MTGAADSTVRAKLQEAIREREKITRWLEAAGAIEEAMAQLSRALGIDPADDLAAIHEEIVDGPHLPSSEWAAAAAAFARKAARRTRTRRRVSLKRSRRAMRRGRTTYLGVFFTDKGEPRSVGHHQASCQGVSRLSTTRLTAEKARLEALVARRRAVVCRDRTAALITLAREVIARYGAEKDRRGLLDYDDLIDKAGAMLDRVDSGWVHYKLDLGLDHILIDEAQDTSEKQWRIVRQLVAEFAAGAGARGLTPARCSRWATRSSRSSRSRARRRASTRRCAATLRRVFSVQRDRMAARAVRSFVPLRRRTCSARSMRCSPPPRSIAASPATKPACRDTSRCRRRCRASSKSGR